MGLEVLVAGSLADVDPLNNNFSYLDGRITTEVGSVSSTVSSHTSSINTLNTNVAALQGENIKTGMIIYYTKSSAPTGYLVCDGSAVSRTTYATLFNAIGTTFGSGDGSTTFNLPNLINKYIKGNSTVGTSTSASTRNTSGQSANHTHTIWGYAPAEYTIQTGGNNEGHSHTYTSGVDSLTLLPCIKY